MGYGMFVRPTALKLLAEPAAPLYPQPKKKGRPSSMFSTSSRGSTPADPGLTKRISLNAPSPTPSQKQQTRTPTGIRVSRLLYVGKSATLTNFSTVTHQITHQATGHCAFERSSIPHYHPVQCKTCPGSSLTSGHRHGPTLDGPASDASQANSSSLIGRRSKDYRWNSQDYWCPYTYP